MIMELTNEIYLNCGIYDDGKISTLFIGIPGYFANEGWRKSDEAYNEILGTKFEGMTADDGKAWLLHREYIRRLNENDNIDELLANSCEEFKTVFNEKFGITKSTLLSNVL